ncbi:hypothetical protein XNC1_4591 [Xenorhabdus nematophila ATCC 19061]|uniref:Uncharacterized protein n=1 Tax=Xenorhabdus nematophila (strain ATCC 19061 / DSM 3370 / CCUG 14189 / LMG 1036 / NCIMB 9965 / AN6) TaxID=406817 RepID=D3VFU7_XENNA|nr:hypothetical protein XNC1_4591 [Xenorhabdus nematophila ATCC 19061]CEF32140.1 hypothetical protein XNW1_4240073 [Xenorhabdus nematophila str. Websteri]CEK25419.1 hypothetical protein XNC2_4432 [Xenorhabdus nematophila AN6/1]
MHTNEAQKTFMQLALGVYGGSPILVDNKITGKTFTFSPYLSIINGKVVISR